MKMGRKEKCVDSTTNSLPTSNQPPAQSSIISFRTYTRQTSKSNPVTMSNTNSVTENESDSKQMDDSTLNNLEKIIPNANVVNGKELNAKGKRRSNLNKSAANEVQVSSIAQRPRRQVIHKFIKSANINVNVNVNVNETNANNSNSSNSGNICNIKNVVNNKDAAVNDEPSAENILNSLSPNRNLRLVPMVHRLPINGESVNRQDVCDEYPNERDELNEVQQPNAETEEQLTGVEMLKIQRQKNKRIYGKPSVLRQLRFTSESLEANNSSCKTDNENDLDKLEINSNDNHTVQETCDEKHRVENIIVEKQSEEKLQINEIVVETKEEEEMVQPESTLIQSAFDEDEDDVMFVEPKDALDVPNQLEFVAEEVVIDGPAQDEYVLCDTSDLFGKKNFSNSDNECRTESEHHETDGTASDRDAYDSSANDEPVAETTSNECDNPSEPIYLSDSLSCFDSDSDTQESDVIKLRNKSDSMPKHEEMEDIDEVEALNESMDDLIMIQESVDTISIGRSDSDDDRFASKFSFVPFVENDSQVGVESVDVVDLDKCENNDIIENIENGFKPEYMSERLDETTSDADDDMSEVEKRTTRSRRDNNSRKNYSYRRTYAKRKSKNDSETQHQQSNELIQCKLEPDSLSNDVQQTQSINTEVHFDNQTNQSKNTLIKLTAQDSNTTDGTDEDSSVNPVRTKATRTYLRRNALLHKSVSFAIDSNELKNVEKSELDLQSENTASSSNDIEFSDSKTEEIALPRKRGRPRKKNNIPNSEHKQCAAKPIQHIGQRSITMEGNETTDNTTADAISELPSANEISTDVQSSIDTDETPDKIVNKSGNDVVRTSENLVQGNITAVEPNTVETETIDTIMKDQCSEDKHQYDNMEVDGSESGSVSVVEPMDCFVEELPAEKMESDCSTEHYKRIESATEEAAFKETTDKNLAKTFESTLPESKKNKDHSNRKLVSDNTPNIDPRKIPIRGDSVHKENSSTSARLPENETRKRDIEPTPQEPIDKILVKIEQIAIETSPKENATVKPVDAVRSDVRPHEKPLGVKMEIKSEEKPQKETEMASALVDLSKEMAEELGDTSIRRSGRIRTINKSKQRSQGLGVVKDKKRAPVIVDEDSSSASFDVSTDNTMDKEASQTAVETKVRVKTEEELEKERIDRENGMKLFVHIADNEYRSERTISKEAKKMTCDCFLTHAETERGEMGCGDDCLNRMLLIECSPKCTVGDRCTNRRFQKHENSPCNIFKTEKKGYGLIATSYIPAGAFIMEYVGEVLNSKQFEKRASDYSKQMNAHYYFMALSSDCVIDATKKGNISRFINHSCDPNAETQKWTVNGELRIGFFSKTPIMADEEITFDYQFQRYGKEAQKCYCEATNCRGWIGGEPDSEEELESDDDEESEDDASTETGKDDSESKIATPDGTTKKKTKTPRPKKPKDATKKPVRKERAKTNRKINLDFQKHRKRAEILEDPDLDKEIDALAAGALKNQVQTLQFSRLMVRAKLQKAKLRLLRMLREGELPCRRLFLDYHGLKLMHSWMTDALGADRIPALTFRLEILQTLENLPITNKTALQDSKVLSTVQRWSNISEYSFLADELQNANNNAKPANVTTTNDESSPSDSGSGTPILNDETSSPKVDEAMATPNVPNETTDSTIINPNATPSTSASEPAPTTTSEQKPTETVTASTPASNVKPQEVPVPIPQILEQNSAFKGIRLDLLKSIISTTEKNTKIIEDTEKLPDGEIGKLVREICLLGSKLVSTWEQLPELFKIPKKLRIEQMKEHEREADESSKENVEEKTTPKIVSSTFSSSGRFNERIGKGTDTPDARDKDPRDKDPRFRRFSTNTTLNKHQRRQMFEAKVAQEDAERKKSMENYIHGARCAFFQLDPRITRDFMVPMSVNPATGQWYSDKMMKIPTPPSHNHIKPPQVSLPTDVNEYHIPPIDLPDLWKYAINEKGQIYYYHTKILIPQWEPPIKLLPLMEEHRLNDIDLKVEAIEPTMHAPDDDHEIEHDCDDEDEDVVSILSNSTMNPNCLLELKSDPILEKYNDDDSSSTDSDDSSINELTELEEKYLFVKTKTDEYRRDAMKKPMNLHEEIAAMAKSDSTGASAISMENVRIKEEERQNSSAVKSNSNETPRKRKKNRAQLVQEIRISPLSEEMKRELRRDSRRYKENKAKLRRQKEMLLKRKHEFKSSLSDAPIRKLKKITEGLPQVSKHSADNDAHSSIDNHSFSVTSFSSSRYGGESFETKRTKPSAFASLSSGNLSASSSSSSMNSSLSTMETPTRNLSSGRSSLPSTSTSLTQSIVNKLPSIGHKFVGDTEELIMKNTIKPIKTAEPVNSPATTPAAAAAAAAATVNSIRSTPTQQTQQMQQHLVKKSSHSIINSAKSSPKPLIKKKKTSDPNESIDVNSPAAKKIKEKFKSDISGDIVKHLRPYFSKTCIVGQIQSSDDFRHLARKLTFFVMLKELKYCNNVSLLEVTDSVKNKAREYIKKYMSKFGKTYIRDENEKDYHFEDL